MEYLAFIGTALGSGFVVQMVNIILNRKKREYGNSQDRAKSELVWKEAHDALDEAFAKAQKRILLLQRGLMELEVKLISVESENMKLKNELAQYTNPNESNSPHAGPAGSPGNEA